jgi:hypothetical protein
MGRVLVHLRAESSHGDRRGVVKRKEWVLEKECIGSEMRP